MSEALENVFIAEVETSRRNERPAQREWLLCSGGSRCHLPQEVTLGWAGELPGRCSLGGGASRRFGDNGRRRQRFGHGWHGRVCGTNTLWLPPSFPPSHTVTEPWLPPRFSPSTDFPGRTR